MKNRNFIASLSCAIKGFKHLVTTERNFKFDIVMAILVIICSLVFPLLKWERCVVFILTALCIFAEAVNSSLERIVDLVTDEYHPLAGQAKDIASTAVLIIAIMCAVVGLYIFVPYGLDLLKIIGG